MKPDQLKEEIEKIIYNLAVRAETGRKVDYDKTIDDLNNLFNSHLEAREIKTDFPTAWKIMNMTDPEQHHEKCSFRQSKGGLLCDCAAEKVFIATVKLAQTPSKDLGDTK